MAGTAQKPTSAERELEARYQARLDAEVARLREQSQKAVEEFKRSFPPPTEEQIERLLYPELSEFSFELGGNRFVLRELPALTEKKFLRLVEQRLPALVAEILRFDERLGDDPAKAFTHLLTRANSALDLVSEACALVLDPAGDLSIAREFVQKHASTQRQLRILQAQLLLNAGRDFLSQLFPALRTPAASEGPVLRAPEVAEGPALERSESLPTNRATNDSPQSSVGWNSSGKAPEPLPENSHWDNSP